MTAGESGHQCKCKEICNPDFDEEILLLAMDAVHEQVKTILRNGEKEEIRVEYSKEIYRVD